MTIEQAIKILDPAEPPGSDAIAEMFPDIEGANRTDTFDIVYTAVREASAIAVDIMRDYLAKGEHGCKTIIP